MGAEIKGIDNLKERLEGFMNEEKLQRGLEKGCMRLERLAKQKAPKKSGELRRSITHKVEGNVGVVFTPLFYAPYVEYGTGIHSTHEMGGRKDVPWVYYDEKENEYRVSYGQHAHPYMRPALNEAREQIVDDIWKELLKK